MPSKFASLFSTIGQKIVRGKFEVEVEGEVIQFSSFKLKPKQPKQINSSREGK